MSTPEGSFRTAPSFRQTSSAKAPPLVTAHTCSMPNLLASRPDAAACAEWMTKLPLQNCYNIRRRLAMGHTWSPCLTDLTLAPTSVTMPETSEPGMKGSGGLS